MNFSTLIRDRRAQIIAAAIAVGLLLSIILLSIPTGSNRKTISEPYATNLAFAHQTSADTLNFFTGSAFASYNLTEHSTKALTPLYSLPRLITTVTWGKDAVLFNAAGYSDVDQLYPELVRQNLNPNNYYWWRVDLRSGAISLVGNQTNLYDVRSVIWESDTTYLFAEQPGATSDQIVSRVAPGQAPATIGTIPPDAILVGGSGETVTYSIPKDGSNEVTSANLKTKTTTSRLENVLTVLAGNPAGSILAIKKGSATTDEDNTIGDLTYYDATKQKTKSLQTGFRGKAIWTSFNSTFIVNGTNDAGGVGFVIEPKSTTNFQLIPKDNSTKYIEYAPAGFTKSAVLLTNPKDELVSLTNGKAKNLPSLPDMGKLKPEVNESNFRMVYVAEQNQFSTYITQTPYEGNRQAIMNYLKNKGYDPYQLKIKWYAYDNVPTPFALPPEAKPVEEPIPVQPDLYDVGD